MDDALIADISNDELVTSLAGQELLTVSTATSEDALVAALAEDEALAALAVNEVERFGYLPISVENDRMHFMLENTLIVYYVNGPQSLGEVPYRTITPGSGEPVVINCETDYGLIIDARGLEGQFLSIDVVNWPATALGIVHLLVKTPPSNLSIGWPSVAARPLPIYWQDMNCEFELRSWDGGQTVSARTVSLYPFKD